LDWLVLVKVVPDADGVRFDPVRRTLIREGVELFANPFDQRAVRVALDHRAAGETVTVVSMGPPNAAEGLIDSLALGVDRAILITDPALSGSDTLVTARVLASAARRVGSDLILTGRWSTDSETGQVAPEVAALLGRPYVPTARRIERAGGSRIEVEGDTTSGSVRYRVPLPAVVGVGEKIVKLRKPTEPERDRARIRGVERWPLAALDLSPNEVGEAGSPTVVGRLREVAPHRTPRRFSDGTVAERVEAAWATTQGLLERSVPASTAPAWSGPGATVPARILVLASDHRGRCSAGATSVLGELLQGVPAATLTAAWIGAEPSGSDRAHLSAAGAARLLWVESRTDPVEDAVAAVGVEELLRRHPSIDAVVFVADEFGRAVGGRVAADRSLGLTGDAVGIEAAEGGSLVFWKPAFGGGVLAEVRSRTRPALATLRPAPYRRSVRDAPIEIPLDRVDVRLPPPRLEFLGEETEVDAGWRSPLEARLVVAVGLGVGGPDGVAAVRAVAEEWGAAVVATRKVVDAGWVPRQLQVGLTGHSLAPELAVLVGASARPNHLIGFRRAKVVLSVNSDAAAAGSAPVDVAVVGRWEEVLPEITRRAGPWLRTLSAGPG
jgi:electron transfer flavoprotein alpha subunit